jgi:glutamyl/glutaminyl-tRNA synthetase
MELEFESKKNIYRYRVEEKGVVYDQMGDFILWRKEDIPSYQLASLVDDLELGTNFLVRGQDLYHSTMAQELLAKGMGKNFVSRDQQIHHPLLLGSGEEKLGKSKGSDSLKNGRQNGLKVENVYASFYEFLKNSYPQANWQNYPQTIHRQADLLELVFPQELLDKT